MFFDTQLLVWGLPLAAAVILINHVRRGKRQQVWRPAQKTAPRQEASDELFEEAIVGYLEVDGEGVVQRINRRECELRGLTADAILGNHYEDLEPSGSRERCGQELNLKVTQP